MFFVSVASKGIRFSVSSLFSTVPRGPVSVDSKQVMVAVLGLFVSVDSKLLIVAIQRVGEISPHRSARWGGGLRCGIAKGPIPPSN
jgi:hypothetical protein